MAPLALSINSSTAIVDVCFSNDCIKTASSILQSIDMNIDPCSDFYQYTCGNWIKDAVIPEELAGFGILEVESKRLKDKLRMILDGTYKDLLSATLSRSSFQVEHADDIKIDKKNFGIIQDYYNSCLDIEINSDNVLSSFFQDLSQLKYEEEFSQQQNLTFHITPNIMTILTYPKSSDSIIIEVGGLFSMEISPDAIDKKIMSIALYPPSEFNDLYVAPFQDEGSTKLFGLVSSVFGMKNSTARDRDRLSYLMESGLEALSDDKLYTLVEDAITVQQRLFQLTNSEAEELTYNFTLDEIDEIFPFVAWLDIFEANIPKGRDMANLTIQISNIEYFNELNYFSNVDDPTRTLNKDAIQNYLIVHKIHHEAPNLDPELRMLMPDTPFQTRSSLCVDKLHENLGLLTGRFYAMIASHGESDRLRLESIANNIKASLGNRIQQADWLDEPTRESAIKKLNKMSQSISYSVNSPDERSPRDMHAYMRGLKQNGDSFYENEKAVTTWTLQTYWDTLCREMNPNEWIGISTPQVVNAFNLLSKNNIVVSVAFAQKPNYDQSYPDYLNYGGIGQTLAHEYSHAFDDYGSQYDEIGAERNWWSESTKMKYAEKTQCFVDQYSKATVVDENGKKYSIDGSLTLGENIADNEGLSATYDAYLKSKLNGKGYNPILPGLQQFSSEALFFINAGRSFCSKPLRGTIKDSLADEHAPDSIRANKVFQNNVDFAKIFNCPVGSKMNPITTKCKIW
ncbi:uncharacterized protein EV154DRAFT_450821 [Mucor mucedo]|uniref:uncharacterized protein n=1 Tax=Mucor mucedo TaxID=29922 RepID=UPI00221FA030|nr:uncharacterized protein EV154DRAFT_450821 [Mucor mucedo]KAI7879828.1 hypothetical protein EV154DRAFT_450821 [Mucor mucedo]